MKLNELFFLFGEAGVVGAGADNDLQIINMYMVTHSLEDDVFYLVVSSLAKAIAVSNVFLSYADMGLTVACFFGLEFIFSLSSLLLLDLLKSKTLEFDLA